MKSTTNTAALETSAREQLAQWGVPQPTPQQVENVVLVLGNMSYREHR